MDTFQPTMDQVKSGLPNNLKWALQNLADIHSSLYLVDSAVQRPSSVRDKSVTLARPQSQTV